ncbi:hypothetical protein Patl1_07897 [Pistacia atlantica]|uniref:Uncharacterized protein n=1 Tax=Pistacia atlantica TaxID=434234 RepID=A0ACC1AGP3_9ROSI|nr:hypothetical protein Patl1_07897 [Pistacia atlantica]
MRFDFINDGLVQDVTSLNSKQFPVNFLGPKNFRFHRFTVIAPVDSLNIDGIHIKRFTGIDISHDISVGSLGKYVREEPVDGINVRGRTLSNTDNGVRIRTWPTSYAGIASNMRFEYITIVNVINPIIINSSSLLPA